MKKKVKSRYGTTDDLERAWSMDERGGGHRDEGNGFTHVFADNGTGRCEQKEAREAGTSDRWKRRFEGTTWERLHDCWKWANTELHYKSH